MKQFTKKSSDVLSDISNFVQSNERTKFKSQENNSYRLPLHEHPAVRRNLDVSMIVKVCTYFEKVICQDQIH